MKKYIQEKKYNIATAKNRFETTWKNKEVTFQHFIKRLSIPTTTNETTLEYINMSKTDQDNIKDVGCYITGELIEGKRTKQNIKCRSMLALDVDFATMDFVEDIQLIFQYDYILHSTKKHNPHNPRYRLIIPLSRLVTSEEYEALGRKVAYELGIDMFDDLTYQGSRFMYWPSVSCDQRYEFFSRDKSQPLDVERELAKYDNWRECSTWHTSTRVSNNINSQLLKQKNPTEKNGVIGAFCNVYDVPLAIEKFLPNVYKPSANGRYTYVEGSTSGGVVVYEDGAFSYSNHQSDPAGGRLCNAFDLVRIHKFLYLDDNTKENTPVNKLPSFLAMTKFVSEDGEVKKFFFKQRKRTVTDDFLSLDYGREDEVENLDWLEKLEMDGKGRPLSTIDNILIILNNDVKLKGKIVYDCFNNAPYAKERLPWGKKSDFWSDVDDSRLRHYLENSYGIKKSKPIDDGLMISIYDNEFHPIKDYLQEVTWDGVERVETLFIDYLGAEDNEYVKEVTKITLVGAVKRVFEPGCKFDTAIVLCGGQGKGKTEIVQRLGGKWFSNSLSTFRGREAFEQLQGSWIIEIGELEALKKNELETIKHFMSKTSDKYRGAYQRRTETTKRQCIFIGTSNNYDFLKDPTGDRRWYPVDIGEIDCKKNLFVEMTKDEVHQIWAEAYKMYTDGILHYLKSEKIIQDAKEKQLAHREESPYQGIVDNYIEQLVPYDWDKMSIQERKSYLRNNQDGEGDKKMDKVCILQIWIEALDGQKKDLTRSISNDIKRCLLRHNRWKSENRIISLGSEYGRQKAYFRN